MKKLSLALLIILSMCYGVAAGEWLGRPDDIVTYKTPRSAMITQNTIALINPEAIEPLIKAWRSQDDYIIDAILRELLGKNWIRPFKEGELVKAIGSFKIRDARGELMYWVGIELNGVMMLVIADHVKELPSYK
jgi:hypothetical protein